LPGEPTVQSRAAPNAPATVRGVQPPIASQAGTIRGAQPPLALRVGSAKGAQTAAAPNAPGTVRGVQPPVNSRPGTVKGPQPSSAPRVSQPGGACPPSRITSAYQYIAGLIRLRIRQFQLGYNMEQQATSLREGLGGARYEQATGRTVTRGTTEGIDFVDPRVGPISLKGPAGLTHEGTMVKITQPMVDGLARSVIKDVKYNTATKRVVVDTMDLTPAQKASLLKQIQDGVGPSPKKNIFIVE